jgi:hypothetical protein
MAFIADGNGGLRVGPPEGDPRRESNARFVAEIAGRLELDVQAQDAYDGLHEAHKAAIAELEKRVAFLEELLAGTGRAA